MEEAGEGPLKGGPSIVKVGEQPLLTENLLSHPDMRVSLY